MKKLFLLFISFWLFYGVCVAQSDTLVQNDTLPKTKKQLKKIVRKNRARYFELGTGITSYKLQDFAVSPLYYKGVLSNTKLDYFVKGDDLEWGIFLNGAFGKIKSPRAGTKTTIINPQLNFHYLRKINKFTGERLRTYIGGYAMYGGNSRINKSFFNTGASFYDVVFSYGLSGKINTGFDFESKSFKWNHQGDTKKQYLAVDFQLFIPLFHSYLRPDYAVISNFPSTETKVLPPMKTVSWGKLARLTTQLDLTYFLKNNNAIRFSYRWDAYSINPGFNREAVSANSYMVSLLFRLNKKILE